MTALALGTANWGASYGAPGRATRVEESVAAELARTFTDAGHDLVDTAAAYGEAESVVGRVLGGRARVVTKVALPPDDADAAVAECISSVETSCRRTGATPLAGLLLHDPQAALARPETARRVLDQVRERGLARRVGVSVYTPAEATAAVELVGADLLQVPGNLLDQRFTPEVLTAFAAAGVELHLRSVFLNGIVLMAPRDLPRVLVGLGPAVNRVRAAAEHAGRSPLHLAVGYAAALPVDAVVVGAFTVAQLQELLQAWSDPSADTGVEWAHLACDSPLVDPRTWSS